MLERLFQLSERGTTVRTEVLAGLTTFLTMAYIVLVNPAILGQAGMPVAGVAAAPRPAPPRRGVHKGGPGHHPRGDGESLEDLPSSR